MERIRRTKNSDYTTISNVFLRDKRLSLEAKGFLALVTSLPENELNISDMSEIARNDTKSIDTILGELVTLGYCKKEGNTATFYQIPQ